MRKKLFVAALCLALCAQPLTAMAEGNTAAPAVSLESGGITLEGEGLEGVLLDVSEPEGGEGLLEALRGNYPGSSPRILWHREIICRDAGTGEERTVMGSLAFPVPDGYDSLKNPRVLARIAGTLYDLYPERREDQFYIENAGMVKEIIVADLPVPLTGLSIPGETKVNVGQKATLQVSPLPEGATERLELGWASSDELVASVDGDGVVRGVKTGSCTVTASVKGRPELAASCEVTVVAGTHALSRSVGEVLSETRDYMLKTDKSPTVGSEWFALGLARGGLDPDNKYFKTYYNHFANYLAENKGVLTNTIKFTEYSRTIVALTAMGADARDVGGYNLFEPLADFETVCAQGINGPIWALIAMNSHPDYGIPVVEGVQEQTTEDRLISYILENETPLSGWSLLGDSPDPDITGMALQAFAPYYGRDGYGDVTAAVDRALEALSGMQDSEGGFSSWGAQASESAVQVLTGLCALGIDPAADGRFVKGGAWLVENLLSFHVDGSGFMHVKPGSDGNGGAAAGEVDGMATEQGYYALVAYQRFLDGKTALYDMSDVAISPGGKGDGKGTGLEPPATPNPTVTPRPTATQKPTAAANPGGSTGKQLGTSESTGKQLSSAPESTSSGRSAGASGGSSGNKTSAGDPDSDVGGSGWDFEAEDYAFDSGSGMDTGWDAGAIEELPEEAIPASETAAEAGGSRGGLAMMLLWAFGALCGVAAVAVRRPLALVRNRMGLHGEAPAANGRRDPRVVLIGWLSGLQDLLERSIGK